jgi:hypothetical protein
MRNKMLFQNYSFQVKPQCVLQIVKPKSELNKKVNCQTAKRMLDKIWFQKYSFKFKPQCVLQIVKP